MDEAHEARNYFLAVQGDTTETLNLIEKERCGEVAASLEISAAMHTDRVVDLRGETLATGLAAEKRWKDFARQG